MSPTTGGRIVRTVCIKSWYTNGVRVFLWHLLNASLRKLWQQRWVRHQTAEVGREADETVFSGVEYLLLRSWISWWQPASHLCHHPDFCAKQIWQKTPRKFAEKHTLLSASWNLMRSSFWSLDIACLMWNLMSYLGWTFAQSEDDKRHFRLLLEPDAVWKYPFSLQTLYTHKDKIKKSNSVWLVFQFLSYHNSDFVFWLQRLCMDPIAGKSAHQQRHKCDLRICTSGGPALFKPAKNCPNFSYIFHFCLWPKKLCPFCILHFCTLGKKKDHKMISSYDCNFYRASR